MLIQLPLPVIVILDFLGWFVIHMGMAYLFTRLPERYINTEFWLFRPRQWERNGSIYSKILGVKRWKEYLPDGAALFKGGFRKKRLTRTGSAYYRRFIIETCRGEAAHWAVIFCTPVFFIWNYWWVNIIMVLYALTANIPCIVTQRYNRLRLHGILRRKQQATGVPA